MNYSEAIEYLTRCADDNGQHWSGGRRYEASECPTCKGTNDAGWLGTPGSRYGHTSAHVAPIVYRAARLQSRMNGDGWYVSRGQLDHLMSLAVNDSEEPEAIIREFAERASGADIDGMVYGYLEAQLWAQIDMERLDDQGNSPALDENYDVDDVAEDYVDDVREEFASLVTEYPIAVRMYLTQRKIAAGDGSASEHFGHDFYLTREGHGVGFRDRGLGELGDYLTKISKWAGPASDLWDNGNGELSA
jgi:hypothetical protein